ncbi:MAG: ATP-binding protein [Actinomycetota bacterium]
MRVRRIALCSAALLVGAAAGAFPTAGRLDVAVIALAGAFGILPGLLAVIGSAIGFRLHGDPAWVQSFTSLSAAVVGWVTLRVFGRRPTATTRSRSYGLRLTALLTASLGMQYIDNLVCGESANHWLNGWAYPAVGLLTGAFIAGLVFWRPRRVQPSWQLFLVAVALTAASVGMLGTVAVWRHNDDGQLIEMARAAANGLTSSTADTANVVNNLATAPSDTSIANWTKLFSDAIGGHKSLHVLTLEQVGSTGTVIAKVGQSSIGEDATNGLQKWLSAHEIDLAAVSASGITSYVGIAQLSGSDGNIEPFLIYASPTAAQGQVVSAAFSLNELLSTAVASAVSTPKLAIVTVYAHGPEGDVVIWTSPLSGQATVAMKVPFVQATPPAPRMGSVAVSSTSAGPETFEVVAHRGSALGTPIPTRRVILLLEALVGLLLAALAMRAYQRLGFSEQERGRREALLSAALEGSPGWTSILDANGGVAMTNSGPHGLAVGTDISTSALWADNDEAITEVRRLIAQARTGTAGNAQHLWTDPSDPSHAIRIFEIDVRPLPDVALVHFQCIDVTERRDRAMRTAQSERMEAIGVLAGGLAHDFNNLLFITLGNLQMLERLSLVKDNPQAKTYVERAIESVERGAVVAGSLLSVARSQPLTAVPLNLSEFVDGLAPMLNQALRHAHTLTITHDDDGLDVVVDPGRLSSTLLNIVFNARDAMEARGGVDLDVRHVTSALAGGEPIDMIAISITDNGRGMPPEVLTRAFEPFFTTKQLGSGTGLGLSTVFSFAEQSGGWATLDSVEGVGTTVTVLLPPALDPPARLASTDTSAPTATRALVVDDEGALADLVAAWLEDLGIQTKVATTPEAAIRLADEFHPELLISDANLGADIDGLELARILVQRDPNLVVVFMTGFSDRIKALQAAGVATLAKPFTSEDLAATLVAHLGGR